MIDFYTWTTPNGRKVSILLEELGVKYNIHSINIGQGEQHEERFWRSVRIIKFRPYMTMKPACRSWNPVQL